MEEKLLNLMEKMYKEFTDIKTQMATRDDLDKLENRMTKIETKLENDVIDKVRALYDNREIQAETNDKLLNTLARIETKIDVLQMETAHIRRIK